MSSGKPPPKSARPPGTDWQDSYFSLDERYRQLQKKFNEQEQALKLVKVNRRKEEAPPLGPSLSSVAARRPSVRPATSAPNTSRLTSSYLYEEPRGHQNSYSWTPRAPPGSARAGSGGYPVNAFATSAPPTRPVFDHLSTSEAVDAGQNQENTFSASPSNAPTSSFIPANSSQDPAQRTQEYVPVPSAAGPQVARAAAIAEASAWGDAAALPDPSMVWGTDGQSSMQNYVVASALYHANEELRRKLNESATTLQTLQQELAHTRSQHASAQTRLDNAVQQMHQLVRERDLASQKYTNASHTIADLERTLRDRVAEEEKIRFSMESQITELRSRLVVGADSNELLQKDVRSLLAETRDRTGEVMQLRSKLALAESALSSQRNVNENMLVELKSLNVQLVEERKRLITITREAQVASLNGTRIADLQEQLRRVQAERSTLEREHVGLMSEFVRVTEDALRHAREEVRTDVADWKAAAEHWEQVSQLLYKDIAERTRQHLDCREECEAAKEQRDAAGQQVRVLKEEVALLSAKLDVVWPTHVRDTRDLSAEEILNVFGGREDQGIFLFDERRRRAAAKAAAKQRRKRRDHDAAGAVPLTEAEKDKDGEAGGVENDGEGSSGSDLADSVEERHFAWATQSMNDFPADPTTAAAQLREVHEVNAALLAEVHQLRLTNDMLQGRLDSLAGQQKSERARVAAVEVSLEKREKAGHQLLEKQLDRVAFLEAQVRSLRGYHVPANVPVDQIGDNENIFELFLGQLVAADVPEGLEVPDLFAHVFCSVDFLLHETITTPTVRGLNGFFDVTASFCVSMDALLFYYLHTRRLLVQLHRVRSEGEAVAAVAAAAQERQADARIGGEENGGADKAGRGSVGRASSGSGSTHPSLRMAESMFETIAEGQVSLVDIVLSEDCQHSARPSIKGHVRLLTPANRHIASLEFRLTARRPYSPEFLQVLQSATVTERGADDDAADGTKSRLMDWMQVTAGTSAEADLQPLSDPHVFRRTAASGPAAESTREGQPDRSDRRTNNARENARASRIHPTNLQLIPISEGEEVGTSSSSSFHVQQRSRMAGVGGALVVHLPAPSPPPLPASRNVSPWSARATSSAWDVESTSGHGEAHRDSAASGTPAGQESVLAPQPSTASFVHVDRTLLSQQASALHDSRGGSGGPVTCLWVDVERLELPADLPVPIPRLSCYFRVPVLQKEVWLAAPPTARYTWPYAASTAHDDGTTATTAAAGAYGSSFAIRSVAELSAVVREPLVLFFLDADAMAATPAASTHGSGTSGGESCVWAMVVCEWGQVVQQADCPHHFSLPLLRGDGSVVVGAVVRLTLTATTATTVGGESNLHAPPPLPASSGGRRDTSTVGEGWRRQAASGSGSATAPSPTAGYRGANPSPLVPAPSAGTAPISAPGVASPASMDEELLRLEYDSRVSRSGF